MWARLKNTTSFLFVLVLLFSFVFSSFRSVMAIECPEGMSDLDCQALKYSWENWVPDSASGCGSAESASVTTSTDFQKNLEQAYNYFLSKKGQDGAPALTDIQAAAIIGNIAHESGGDPQNTQGGYSPDRTQDPAQVSPASGGWGLIQWTPAAKVIGIAEKANITGPIYELQTQLDIVWWHMNNSSPTGVQNMLASFTQTDLGGAVEYYERTMEGAGVKAIESRVKAAKVALKYTRSATPSYTSASSGCQCSTENTNQVGGTGTVVLDPGHSGIDKEGKETDTETGLFIGDSSNPGERKQMWDVAVRVKSVLEGRGYKVIMTKQKEDDYVNLRQRALIANEANAAIAVSIHSTPGTFGGGASWVTEQKVGGYRTNQSGQNIKFDNQGVASKSALYADKMVVARRAAGEPGAINHDLSFEKRDGLSPGNLAINQLLSQVPWIYNEAGQTGLKVDAYAKGIAEGIMSSVQPSDTSSPDLQAKGWGGQNIISGLKNFISPKASALETVPTTTGCGAGAASGSVVQTALNYAWPKLRNPDKPGTNATEKRDTYEAAIVAAKKAGKYTGDPCFEGGVDCGAFVTRVMQDSGVDPEYGNGGNTIYQQRHLKENPDMYVQIHPKSTAELSRYSFAIAINSGHTYLYVGKQPNFETTIASASQCRRAPMAGWEVPADPSYAWYVLKAEARGI